MKTNDQTDKKPDDSLWTSLIKHFVTVAAGYFVVLSATADDMAKTAICFGFAVGILLLPELFDL